MVHFDRKAAEGILNRFIHTTQPAGVINQYGSEHALKKALQNMFWGIKIQGVEPGDDVVTILRKGVSEAQKDLEKLPMVSCADDGGYVNATKFLSNGGQLQVMTGPKGLFTVVRHSRQSIDGVPGLVITRDTLSTTPDLQAQVMKQEASSDSLRLPTEGRSITKRHVEGDQWEIGTYPDYQLNSEIEVERLQSGVIGRSRPYWTGDVVTLSAPVQY